jgi:hypothetical protein
MILFAQTSNCVITIFVGSFTLWDNVNTNESYLSNFPFFYILSQNLVFDNRSQHSDVEKKREREKERKNNNQLYKKKKKKKK